MESNRPSTSMDLQEFHRIPLCSKVPSYIERLYVQQGLLPPLSELAKVTEKKLQEILKPRPFVKPIVRRKKCLANRSIPLHQNATCLSSLPTPPYESDPLTTYQSARSSYTQLTDLCEDLEGIADVAPGSPQPAHDGPHQASPSPSLVQPAKPKQFWGNLTARKSTTSAPGPHQASPSPSLVQPAKPKQSWGNLTARKSTTSAPSPSVIRTRECSVVVVDLQSLQPEDTKKLLRRYYAREKVKRRRSESADSGNATDEPEERLVPPLRIRLPKPKPTVHEVLGRIAICPAIELPTPIPQLQGTPGPTNQAPDVTSSPSCETTLRTEEPPSKKIAVLQRLEDSHNLPKASPVANRNRTLKPGTILIDALPLAGCKAPLKGILKNIGNSRDRFLPNFTDDKSGPLISLPTDVVQTCEFNFTSKKIIPLSIRTESQKELNLKQIQLYPQVCIQCNATFSSMAELSTHALASNHSLVFNY